MLNHEVKKILDSHITKTYILEPDKINFLLNHERKNLLIDNLVREIRAAQLKTKLIFDKETMQGIVRDFCNMFCKSALVYKHDQLKSDIQRTRDQLKRERESKLNNFSDDLEELPEGVVSVERPRRLTSIDS